MQLESIPIELKSETTINPLFLTGYKRECKRILSELQKASSPEDLRAWLTKALPVASTRDGNSASIPKEQWPSWINSIQSRYPFIGASVIFSNTSTNARFVWGSGRGLCGYDVNLSTNRPSLSETDFFILEWVPGIYAWHSRNDH